MGQLPQRGQRRIHPRNGEEVAHATILQEPLEGMHSHDFDLVITLTPLTIPEQPEDNWFDALADTPAIASPLETLAWLHVPDSPSVIGPMGGTALPSVCKDY